MKKWVAGFCVCFFLSVGFVSCSKEEAKGEDDMPVLTEEELNKKLEELSERAEKLGTEIEELGDSLDEVTDEVSGEILDEIKKEATEMGDELKDQLENVAGELTDGLKNVVDSDSKEDSSTK